jgi:hypothetical protein
MILSHGHSNLDTDLLFAPGHKYKVDPAAFYSNYLKLVQSNETIFSMFI